MYVCQVVAFSTFPPKTVSSLSFLAIISWLALGFLAVTAKPVGTLRTSLTVSGAHWLIFWRTAAGAFSAIAPWTLIKILWSAFAFSFGAATLLAVVGVPSFA